MVTGVTLGDYIRNRRLSLAANELKSGQSKVIDLALKYGYETHESFTKAFTRFHGVTPSNARKSKENLKYFRPLSIQINIKGGFIMSKKLIPNLVKFLDGMNGENYMFCGAMAQLMAVLDEKEYDYWFFSCITGDTFTQIYNKNHRKYISDLSSAALGKAHLDKVFNACGYAYEYADNMECFNHQHEYTSKIINWIDKGIPVIVRDNDYSSFSLAVGYNESGDILKFNLFNDSLEKYDFKLSRNTNYALIFIGSKEKKPDIAQTYRTAIYDIPNLITKQATPDVCFGKEAFAQWADGLTDGRYANIPADIFNAGHIHSNNLISFGTLGCMKKFIKRISELNPDMTDLINSLYDISAEADSVFHFLAERNGFDYNAESLKNEEQNKIFSDRIKENLLHCDKIISLFN